MFEINNILAIVDFRQSEHFALPRAIELARQFSSGITIISNNYESFIDFIPSGSAIDLEELKAEALKQDLDKLKELVNRFDTSTIDINFEVLWNKSFHQGLINYINKNEFDLVLKTSRSHNRLQKLLFTPTDWHLLRDTQTDILFVKQGHWPSKSNILGAINIEDDDAHRELNKKIIRTTVQLAEACNSKASILNVFPWPMVKFDKFSHLFDSKDIFIELKQKHTSSVNQFVKGVASLSGKLIIAEGLEPEDAIPDVVKSSYSDLLVMGTVGRRGIQAAIIGNTAEKILDELECEVLALK